jgi:hypothetical protein
MAKQAIDQFTRDAFDAPKRGRPRDPNAKPAAQRMREMRLRKKSSLRSGKGERDHFDHHRSDPVALIEHLKTLIAESGDGGFALLLWNALQDLPEIQAHINNVAKVN